jgi:eukaryotic-like serine/threonine-protein kinase
MPRNAQIGLFTNPSKLKASRYRLPWRYYNLEANETLRILLFVAKKHTPIVRNMDGAKDPLERMLNRIQHSDEFPGISKHITAINQKLSASPDGFGASELADMILNDYALTSKLLRLANSVTYGFSSGKVSTVTRAVVILGYEYVSLVSFSLTLFEHLKSKHYTADLKEEMLCSLWSGMMAREIVINQGGDIDSEEAFVCAMLTRLGKLVMIRYFPREYHKILTRIQDDGCSEAKAVKSVCGTSYEELGMAVAKQWNFPPRIYESLQPLRAVDLNQRGKTHSKLQVLSSFIIELSKLIEKSGLNDSEPSLQDFLKRYKLIIISKQQLHTLIKASVINIEQHAHAMDFDTANSAFFSNLRAVLQPQEQTQKRVEMALPVAPSSDSYQLTDVMEIKAGAAGQTVAQPVDMILDGMQEISQAMLEGYTVSDIAMMSVEILYHSLGFHHALMFIRDSVSHMMTARFGYGWPGRQFLRGLEFKVDDAGDLFNHSLQSGKDLIVTDANDPKISHLIPSWYRSHIDAPAFIFLPVTAHNVTIGALYADRSKEGRPITDTEHRHLNMLRNQLALALCYHQGVPEGRSTCHI